MTATYTQTDHYSLNLYGDKDPADLRDGYNKSMQAIDETLKTHLDRIEAVEAHETQSEQVVRTLIGDHTVDGANAAKAKWDKASTDATTALGLATTASHGLDGKVDLLGEGQVTMVNLAPTVRNAITGGAAAVVGADSVGLNELSGGTLVTTSTGTTTVTKVQATHPGDTGMQNIARRVIDALS